MKQRIFGLETEYAISFQSDIKGNSPDTKRIVQALREPLVKRCGLPHSSFLINGSRFYHDVGHAEWSIPECRSAREAAIYDKTADHILGSLIAEAEQSLKKSGYEGHLILAKNNTDTEGNTYGCHENYMAERSTEWLNSQDQLRLTIRYLIPFLVTRQIYCGVGRIGFGPELEEGSGFQIMQRADYIKKEISEDSRRERPIIHIGRENEPLASDKYRRIHLILSDSNMSGWATYLKLGTTGIIVRMLEDLCFGSIPHLVDSVEALKTISRDPSCSVRVPLRDGQKLRALDIQRIYLDQAKSYFENHILTAEEQQIMELWEKTLDELERDSLLLAGKLDWVTKKRMMDFFLEKNGLSWDDELRDTPGYYELLKMDIQYHNLSKQDGLFYRILNGQLDTMVTRDEISRAETQPPPYTRARIRGDAIASSRRAGTKIEVDRWDTVKIGKKTITLDDPLEFFSTEVFTILSEGVSKNDLTTVKKSKGKNIKNTDKEQRIREFAKIIGRSIKKFRKIVNEAKATIEDEIERSSPDLSNELREIGRDIRRIMDD